MGIRESNLTLTRSFIVKVKVGAFVKEDCIKKQAIKILASEMKQALRKSSFGSFSEGPIENYELEIVSVKERKKK
jgi:hypothetical protein